MAKKHTMHHQTKGNIEKRILNTRAINATAVEENRGIHWKAVQQLGTNVKRARTKPKEDFAYIPACFGAILLRLLWKWQVEGSRLSGNEWFLACHFAYFSILQVSDFTFFLWICLSSFR